MGLLARVKHIIGFNWKVSCVGLIQCKSEISKSCIFIKGELVKSHGPNILPPQIRDILIKPLPVADHISPSLNLSSLLSVPITPVVFAHNVINLTGLLLKEASRKGVFVEVKTLEGDTLLNSLYVPVLRQIESINSQNLNFQATKDGNNNIRNPKFLKVQFTSLKMGRRFLLFEATTTRMKKEKGFTPLHSSFISFWHHVTTWKEKKNNHTNVGFDGSQKVLPFWLSICGYLCVHGGSNLNC
ncbi:unnamed protein product [Lactuca saligna]|uniref:Uncharacterized protein n=1 Tax=Lactuca saligna TaxID=75948 RepID=A0AA35YST8_LACSI|nr:unnamed protein product [Lactuca saligna]